MDVADTTVMFLDDGHQDFFLLWVGIGKGDFDSLSKASTANAWSWAAELRPPLPAKTSMNIPKYSFGSGIDPCENLRPSPVESWCAGFWASEAEEASHPGTGDPLLKLAVRGSGRQD